MKRWKETALELVNNCINLTYFSYAYELITLINSVHIYDTLFEIDA